MDFDKQRKLIAILNILAQAGRPMGSTTICKELHAFGITLRERMVRHYLTLADQKGLTQNLGRRGHRITDQGRKEVDVSIAIDKIGFINTRIDELIYRMNFDEDQKSGTLILNTSMIKTFQIQEVLGEIARIMQAQLGMGHYVQVAHPGETIQHIQIPEECLGISTICSVTLNGILIRHGINMTSRFGGLLEMYEGEPVRFRHIINYDGSTIDPLEIFIKSRMTSVAQVAQTGTGYIGASFREIPIAALPQTQTVIKRLEEIGLGGVLKIGEPNQPVLDIPVGIGKVGMIVVGGLNPIAAVEESGMVTTNYTLHNLCDFSQLKCIDTLVSL
ncbi:MAG: DUF128 domain-containing protein [Sedimentisphaerales bacterium]|nr:DUF128 domain-containing protein [Sedimentisphaerales bacterium]